MQGRPPHPHPRMVVVPASREIYLEAMRLGYLETFVQAGASVGTPGCGPCIGRHHGVMAPGERVLKTLNRKFTGCMGCPYAEFYHGRPSEDAANDRSV